MTAQFIVMPWVVVLCAIVLGLSTLLGGWPIHRTLDGMVNGDQSVAGPGELPKKKQFLPYMGVCAEVTSALSIWQAGWVGIPMSTNHAVVSAMAGAKSASGRVRVSSMIRIIWGWVVTYIFNSFVAYLGASILL